MVEILKQGQYVPQAVEKQVLIIFAGTNGFLDELPVGCLKRYEAELFSYVDGQPGDFWAEIREKGTNSKKYKDLAASMSDLLKDFGKQFSADA